MKAEYAHAAAIFDVRNAAHDRQKNLAQSGMISPQELQESDAEFLQAQADLRKSASALKAAGFSAHDLDGFREESDFDVSVPLRARHGGTLVEQKSELGTVVEAGQSVGLIAQTAQLWVEAQIRERELPYVQRGQTVVISSDGDALNRCSGVVSWVANSVDPLTRMGKVRIRVQQNGEALRAHQFVRVEIKTGGNQNAVMIPSEAVQWEGCCNVVFVAETPDRFKPAKVQVEFASGDMYAVTGIHADEKIVTRGSYLLKTELMKGSIGAGCCGEGH